MHYSAFLWHNPLLRYLKRTSFNCVHWVALPAFTDSDTLVYVTCLISGHHCHLALSSGGSYTGYRKLEIRLLFFDVRCACDSFLVGFAGDV